MISQILYYCLYYYDFYTMCTGCFQVLLFLLLKWHPLCHRTASVTQYEEYPVYYSKKPIVVVCMHNICMHRAHMICWIFYVCMFSTGFWMYLFELNIEIVVVVYLSIFKLSHILQHIERVRACIKKEQDEKKVHT